MEVMGIKKVACVGTGVIGTSWALCFAMSGYSVCVYDIGKPQLDNAQKVMTNNLEFLIENKICSLEERKDILKRIVYTTDLSEAVKDAQYIQESGPEDYDIKESILANIEQYVAEDVIIATSTSGLLITEMSKNMKHPERLCGGHPYNPPHLIPLVEIVKGEKTKSETALLAKEFYTSCGKEPVILNKEVTGFISNRLQVAIYREIIDLVVNGVCSLEDADKACLYGPGIRWGVLGPSMIFHLGAGDAGLKEFLIRQRESFDIRAADMADWKHMPQEFIDMSSEGIEEALSHRAPEIGNSIETLAQYRDKMLLEMLRLHKKI